jgi:enoyl-CoA hydratase/carnithine racemase
MMTQPLPIEHDNGVDRVTLNRLDSLSRSEEFGEGIRAFLEKRKPVYIKR